VALRGFHRTENGTKPTRCDGRGKRYRGGLHLSTGGIESCGRKPRRTSSEPCRGAARAELIDLDVTNDAGILEKRLLVDLLNISDPADIGGELEGVTAPEQFSFPFNSIESVVQLGESTLGVAIDNNYPDDSGRRAGVPDDIELIRIDFEQPLSSFSTAP